MAPRSAAAATAATTANKKKKAGTRAASAGTKTKRPSGSAAAAEAGAAKRAPRRRARTTSSYSSYIFKVLRQVTLNLGISRKAMNIVDSFIHDQFERISTEAGRLAQYSRKATLGAREVSAAVRLTLGGELAKHALSEGTKAVMRYNKEAEADVAAKRPSELSAASASARAV